MSIYRKVYVQLWLDADFRRLRQDSKFAWFFLLTGPHTLIFPGLFSLSEMTIAGELGWSVEKANECLVELEEIKGKKTPMLVCDRENHVMFLPSAIKYTQPANSKVAKGWGASLSMVPECALKNEAISLACETIDKRFVIPFQEGLGKQLAIPSSKPYGIPNRYQEAGSRKQEAANRKQEVKKEQENIKEKKEKIAFSGTMPEGMECVLEKIPIHFQDILKLPEKRIADELANTIYELWKVEINSHARGDAIKNLKSLLNGSGKKTGATTGKVPFEDLLSAFWNYSKTDLCKNAPTEKRKTCARFYGEGMMWQDYVDSNPQPDNRPEDAIAVISKNLGEIFRISGEGGIGKNFKEVTALVGKANADVVLQMSRNRFFSTHRLNITPVVLKALKTEFNKAVEDLKFKGIPV